MAAQNRAAPESVFRGGAILRHGAGAVHNGMGTKACCDGAPRGLDFHGSWQLCRIGHPFLANRVRVDIRLSTTIGADEMPRRIRPESNKRYGNLTLYPDLHGMHLDRTLKCRRMAAPESRCGPQEGGWEYTLR